MFIKIQLAPKPERSSQIAKRQGYPIRGASFVASVGVHSAVLAALVLLPAGARVSRRPIYDEVVRPNQHKIVFYDFRKRTPDVVPLQKIGASEQPRGAEVSKQTVIATSRKAVSKKQFIWLPDPKVEIHHDLPAPNLVAQLNISLPAPPAPPPKPSPKAFVPPPADHQPVLPLPVPVLDAPVSSLNIPAIQSQPSLDVRAPAFSAPPATATKQGNASADIAIANLHPAETARSEVPAGERPAQFSKAPDQGKASTGNTGQSGLTVPNLTVRGEKPVAPEPVEPSPGKTILYAERLRSVPSSTVSVPLRPASRTIPRALDARFQGRNVYTMVIPIENFPAYAGDWIIWFAEQTPVPGAAPLMRAPIPFRKVELVAPSVSSSHTVERVQIAGVLGRDGKLAQISIINSSPNKPSAAANQSAVQDMMSWEFKPATRDGAAVNVDVVIEVPLNLVQ